jgi:hypothetical protein
VVAGRDRPQPEARGEHLVALDFSRWDWHGCNCGGCHGKASGQNGFKLSLLGLNWDLTAGERRFRRTVLL